MSQGAVTDFTNFTELVAPEVTTVLDEQDLLPPDICAIQHASFGPSPVTREAIGDALREEGHVVFENRVGKCNGNGARCGLGFLIQHPYDGPDHTPSPINGHSFPADYSLEFDRAQQCAQGFEPPADPLAVAYLKKNGKFNWEPTDIPIYRHRECEEPTDLPTQALDN